MGLRFEKRLRRLEERPGPFLALTIGLGASEQERRSHEVPR